MKRVTSLDIARAAGVSQSTVSLVLNGRDGGISEPTRQKVLTAAQELGYKAQPGRGHALARKKRIAAIVPNLESPGYARILSEIRACAEHNGCAVLIFSIETPEAERECREVLLSGRIDAAIFAFTPDTREITSAIAGKLPAVLLGERDDGIGLDSISLNSRQAGALLVDHLYSLGHRRIAFLSGPSSSISRATRLRYQGVAERIDELGLAPHFVRLTQGDYRDGDIFLENVRSGHAMTRRLLANYPDATGIIAVDDLTCLGVYRALQESGRRIPEDYAVCCFDDTSLTQSLYPAVTAIDYNTAIRVKIAFNLLLERFRFPGNEQGTLKSTSDSNLIVRPSTAKKIGYSTHICNNVRSMAE